MEKDLDVWVFLFEIIRDSWQVLSLVFDSIGINLDSAMNSIFVKGWSNLWSICFACWGSNHQTQRRAARAIYVIECLFALIAFYCFYKMAKFDIKLGVCTVLYCTVL